VPRRPATHTHLRWRPGLEPETLHKVQWGKLTDHDLDVVAGRRDVLAGKIQARYGIAKDEAETQLATWEKKADDTWFA
jgi:uncharacterized protein YjbJ (UPF0337 family)